MNFPFVFFLSFSNFFLSSLARTFPCVVRYSMQKSLISLQNLSIWEGERRRGGRRDGRVGGGMGGWEKGWEGMGGYGRVGGGMGG